MKMIRSAWAWIRREVGYWGQRLNAAVAVIVGYFVTDSAMLGRAIDPFVPDQYKPLIGALAGLLSFAIVNAAAKADATKMLQNGGR